MLLLDLFTLLYKITNSKYWHILNIQAIERTLTHFNVYMVKLLEKIEYILNLQLDIFIDNLRNVMETYCAWKYLGLLVSDSTSLGSLSLTAKYNLG